MTVGPPAADITHIARELAPTGTLRAAINLGNLELTNGSHDDPAGVTVDIAREAARRLGVPLRLHLVDAARLSVDALLTGAADIGFLAVEPARAAQIAFTAPYVLIEGVYVVAQDSPLRTPADVDREGVRVGVKLGSAYDLFLTRTLEHAQLVRGDEGVEVYLDQSLEAGAGVRQPTTAWVEAHPGHRVMPERFQEIQQAAATAGDRSPQAVAWLDDLMQELLLSGFVAESLVRAGQADATVAPPGGAAP